LIELNSPVAEGAFSESHELAGVVKHICHAEDDLATTAPDSGLSKDFTVDNLSGERNRK